MARSIAGARGEAAAAPQGAAARPRLWPWVAGALVTWTATVTGAALAHRDGERGQTINAATAQARGMLARDSAYRRWASRLGGVYAPASLVEPNPRLAGLVRRDVRDGDLALTLVNPAYMVRLVYQDGGSPEFATRLASLRPLYQGSQADPWEAWALQEAERGADEVVAVVEQTRGPALRYLRPDRVVESCLKCHAAQGYRVGDVRGGLSVTIPLAAELASERAHLAGLTLGYGGLWAAGTVGIGLAGWLLGRRLREREEGLREQGRLQAELSRARRLEALGRLAGGVAHDFNNLLTPILGNAALELEEAPEGSPLRASMEEIRDAAERARALTRRLLVFGRPGEARLEALEVGAVVTSLEPLLRRLIGEDVRLGIELDPATPRAMADRAQLELCITNLALNARDAMPGGGALTVAVRPLQLPQARAGALRVAPGGYAAVEVRDSGLGMDEQVRAHLFEPFFTTKPAGRGTGLGLASVHAELTRVGGAVEVESAVGRGTTVRLLLPATEAAPRPAGGPAPQAAGGTEAILVAEDDPAVRRFVVSALAGLGYRVEAPDGVEAVLAAGRVRGRFQLLLTDVVMPGCSGPDLWRRLGEEGAPLPVVFMSGYPAALDQAPELAGRPRIAKPFTARELGGVVRAALDAAEVGPA